MKILISISSLAFIALSSHFCDGSYTRSASNYPRYMPGPTNNNGQFAVSPQQSSSINYGPNQPSFFPTAAAASPSVSASSPSASYLPGYRPFPSSPASSTSPYGGYRSTSPAANNYFSSGASAPPNNLYSSQTSATNFRQWPIPPSVSPPLQPPAFQQTSLNNAANSINGAAPTSSKYGSSVSTNSQQQLKHQIIYTSTVKPPTYSVSFSTSARVGAGTSFGATSYGNSSDSTFGGPTTTGKTGGGDNGYSNWYGTSGGGVGGQPRGLVQPLPSYSPPPSSPFNGRGGQGNENVQATKFEKWGTGPWEGKMYQTPQSQKYHESNRLRFTTESSYSSSYSPPNTQTQEKAGKTKSSTTTTINPSSKNSQPNSLGMSSYNANFPSNSSKESFSVPSISAWNAQPYEKEKGGYGQQNSGKNQQKNSFNEFERDNEIEDEEELNPSREMDKPIRVKKGSFTWKGGDGKLYEIRYTADSLGMHLEERDVLNSIPSPIRIVASDEFRQELKSIESESENEVVPWEEDEQELSSSNRDTSFLYNAIPDSSNKYSPSTPDLSSLSEKEIHDLYRLHDKLQNSNNLWSHRRGDISFPTFGSQNKERSSSSNIETPEIVISFGTGTSSTSTNFIPLSFDYDDKKSSLFPDRNSYYVDPTPTPATQDYSTSSQSPPSQNSQPKKISYAIRHHSYTKSHSSSDNSNQISYDQKQEQPPVIPYNRKQYKRSNKHSGTTVVTTTETPIVSNSTSSKISQNLSEKLGRTKRKETSSITTINRPSRFGRTVRNPSKEAKIK